MITTLINIGVFLLALSILITIHELGHFWAAKLFKMRVEVFSLFFGPKIASVKKGETEYRIGLVPLGGYVKISGMLDESMDKEALEKDPEPWEFRAKPVWQRLIVMLGGIIMNIILGCVVFTLYKWGYGENKIPNEKLEYGIYVPDGSAGYKLGFRTGDKLVSYKGSEIKFFDDFANLEFLVDRNKYFEVKRAGKIVKVNLPNDYLDQLIDEAKEKKEAPVLFVPDQEPLLVVDTSNDEKGRFKKAYAAGFRTNDVVISIDSAPIRTFSEMSAALNRHQNDTIQVVVERGEDQVTLYAPVDSTGKLGVGIKDNYTEHISYSMGQALIEGPKMAFGKVGSTVKSLALIITGNTNPAKTVSGPLKIQKIVGQGFQREGWKYFWFIVGYLSMVLAIMNLLPIPVLDGGHVVFLLIEAVRGKPVSQRVQEIALQIGFFIVIGLMILILLNDIINY